MPLINSTMDYNPPKVTPKFIWGNYFMSFTHWGPDRLKAKGEEMPNAVEILKCQSVSTTTISPIKKKGPFLNLCEQTFICTWRVKQNCWHVNAIINKWGVVIQPVQSFTLFLIIICLHTNQSCSVNAFCPSWNLQKISDSSEVVAEFSCQYHCLHLLLLLFRRTRSNRLG